MTTIRRTDLALEARELVSEPPEGVEEQIYLRAGFQVTKVDITTTSAADAIGKPIGTYTTVELGKLIRREDDAFSDGAEAIAEELRGLLPLSPGDRLLVAGLGNPAITPDAIGHLTLKSTLVTLHLVGSSPEFSVFRPVAAIEPGVLGTTGVESADVIKAVCETVRPAAVIAVDALASRSASRLCKTVQLTNAGIVPGSGIGGGRAALSRDTLGVPVIAVGVPTVVEAATLAADLAEAAGADLDYNTIHQNTEPLIVTPKDIDASAAEISRLIAYSINLALHNGLTVSDVDMLL